MIEGKPYCLEKIDYKMQNKKQDANGNLLTLDRTISNKILSLI